MRTSASQALACSAALLATNGLLVQGAASAEVSRPAFQPFKQPLTGFVEQFLGDKYLDRWSPSKAVKGEKVGEEVFSYVGKWEVKEPRVIPGLDGDEYLIMTNKAAHHAISAPLDTTVDTTKDDVVVQYEVKFQTGLECGGAYLKLLSEDAKGIHAEEFSDKTPYSIMFGPDKCGGTNKVHLIFRYKNPKTGEVEEKHMKAPPRPKIEKTTVLYTLHVKQSDQSYEIFINGDSVKKGKLLEDFEPAFVPPAEIDDPADFKPEDWVDAAKIPDATATKPADWNEDAPLEIPDEDAEMPAGWLEDEPAVIPDPDAEKPEEWDDEEDGDWIAPSVPNPKCASAPGCGKWVRPMKSNPEYKGKWSAPLIDNPAYKGVWKPRKIANPEYYEDKTPLANVGKISAVGFELWSMQGEIAFDNIYVGSSKAEADTFRQATFDVKHPVELEVEEASKPQNKKHKKTTAEALEELKADPVNFVRTTVIDFMQALQENPMGAIRNEPQSAALVGGLLSVIVGLIGFVVSLTSSKPEVQRAAKQAAATTKEKTVDAKTKVAEKAAEAEETIKKRSAKGKDKADE